MSALSADPQRGYRTRETPTQWDTFAWVVILAVIALLFGYGWLEELKLRRAFENHAKTAKGVVTESTEGHFSRGENAESEPPHVEYRFVADQNEVVGTSSETFVETGKEIEIEFLPDDPETNRIKRTVPVKDSSSGFLAVFSAVLSAVFLGNILRGPERGETWGAVPFAVFPFIVLTAGAAILLFCTRDKRPQYPYDQLVQWLTMGIAGYATVMAYRWEKPVAAIPLILLAVTFNPLWPFAFSQQTWSTLHTIAAVIAVFYAFNLKPPIRANEQGSIRDR